MTHEVELFDLNIDTQKLLTACMTRNEWAVSYWECAMNELKEYPYLYSGTIKQYVRKCETWCARWRNGVRNLMERPDVYEKTQDAAYMMHKESQRIVWQHEQLMKRLLDNSRVEYSDIASKLITAKDLLNLAAYALGFEANDCYYARTFVGVGDMPKKDGLIKKYEDKNAPIAPSTLGFLNCACADLNSMIMQALKLDGLDNMKDPNDEVERGTDIVYQQLIRLMLDYEFYIYLYKDGVETLEQAKALYEADMAQRERDKAAKAHREEVKRAKKGAAAGGGSARRCIARNGELINNK